ncbi:CidA/LrgA family protein [Paenibacillus thalictri]|uniref:CidA/LrgA family protein n=1 Tax=Paenibacillus thalictri TaxID=2527873 RepID=A0A4Q9DY99_9BACL|nr:CidA/LrgA family protein [Paenibacillus thalictri]TBL80220.1 CidA/LrgA family protein [Paenibacillus thalictri]
MLGFAILLAFHLVGLAFQHLLHVPLPANVIGLALFTLSLFLKWIKLEWVENTAMFFNKHMLLFFAPVVVGTMAVFPMIREQALTIIVTTFVSWISVLLATGWTVKLLGKKETSSSAQRTWPSSGRERSL